MCNSRRRIEIARKWGKSIILVCGTIFAEKMTGNARRVTNRNNWFRMLARHYSHIK